MGDTGPTRPRSPRLTVAEWLAMLLVPAARLVATALDAWPVGYGPTGHGPEGYGADGYLEVLGFATGGACVWLVVREHVWNWPVGIASNALLFAVFFRARLYSDAGLQVVFFALAVLGWWRWKRGAPGRPELPVTRATHLEWAAVGVGVPLGTLALWNVLLWANGAAPFWDALVAALSVSAQTLLTRKRIEHWLLWITADVISVPLFASRGLNLTAVLYAVFLVMCVTGWLQWRRQLAAQGVPA